MSRALHVVNIEEALVVPTGDALAFARAIDRLSDEPETTRRLGETAQAFARAHCTEQETVDYFARYLAGLRERGGAPRLIGTASKSRGPARFWPRVGLTAGDSARREQRQ